MATTEPSLLVQSKPRMRVKGSLALILTRKDGSHEKYYVAWNRKRSRLAKTIQNLLASYASVYSSRYKDGLIEILEH